MNVVAVVDYARPWRNAGSESVLHNLMAQAVVEGHQATILATKHGGNGTVTLDGVRIVGVRGLTRALLLLRRQQPDLVVSQHMDAPFTIGTAKRIGLPVALLTHGDNPANQRNMAAGPDVTIHNADYVAESLTAIHGDHPHLVCPPMVHDTDHRVSSHGDAITLVNLIEPKGVTTFTRLAEALPDRRFVGVVGGYGRQQRRFPANVELRRHATDMRPIWRETRIVVMPSEVESWGLVALEAGTSGIPAIVHPTPGLSASQAAAAAFCDRDDLTAWVEQVLLWDDPAEYAAARIRANANTIRWQDTARHAATGWVEATLGLAGATVGAGAAL